MHRTRLAVRARTFVAASIAGVLAAAGLAVLTPTVASAAPFINDSLFSTTTNPANADTGSSTAVEVGTRFKPTVSGFVNIIRFYKGTNNTGTHTGHIWDQSTNTLVTNGTCTFSSETSSGWQECRFNSPLYVRQNNWYVASVYYPNGHASYTDSFFTAAWTPSGIHLTSAADVSGNPNGMTATSGLGTTGLSAWPSGGWTSASARNYFTDVRFVSDTTVCSFGVPDDSHTGVPSGTTLTAYTGPWSITDANNPGTITGKSFDDGQIDVQLSSGHSLTISNSKWFGSTTHTSNFALDVPSTWSGTGTVTVQDSEVDALGITAAFSGNNITVKRTNVHGLTNDGVKIGNNVDYECNYIHAFNPAMNAHPDVFQIETAIVNATIKGNYALLSAGNSTVFLSPSNGPSSNGPVTVSDNTLQVGGGTEYVLYADDGPYTIQNVSYTDNLVMPGYATAVYTCTSTEKPYVTYTGNILVKWGTDAIPTSPC